MLDIKGNSTNQLVARLSNFTERLFTFDKVECTGLEGFLQALKFCNFEIQKEICALESREAKRRGSENLIWGNGQILWWCNVAYPRSSREYFNLITRAYDAVYGQDKSFKEDLLLIGYEEISHSIGKTDMQVTVLTEVEMLYQLNRLRIRSFQSNK